MTRRHVLALCSTPLILRLMAHRARANSNPPKIITEPHALSEESRAGFESLLPSITPLRHSLILLPGAKQVSTGRAIALRGEVAKGSLLIWESGLAFAGPDEIEQQRQVLAEAFGIQLGSPITKSAGSHPYVSFTGAHNFLVRSFGSVFQISSAASECVAHWQGIPVAARKQIGQGNLVYLGALLGPSLLASDREAQCAASHLLTARQAPN